MRIREPLPTAPVARWMTTPAARAFNRSCTSLIGARWVTSAALIVETALPSLPISVGAGIPVTTTCDSSSIFCSSATRTFVSPTVHRGRGHLRVGRLDYAVGRVDSSRHRGPHRHRREPAGTAVRRRFARQSLQRDRAGEAPPRPARDGLPARLPGAHLGPDQRHLLRLEARLLLGRLLEPWGGLRDRVVTPSRHQSVSPPVRPRVSASAAPAAPPSAQSLA